MTPNLSWVRLLPAAAVVIGLLGGCSEKKSGSTDTTATQMARRDTISPPRTPPDADHVTDLAQRYTFDADSNPGVAKGTIKHDGNNKPIPKSDEPELKIGAAIAPPNPPAKEEILARVTAGKKDYGGLGVKNGVKNYLYRAKPSSDPKTWTVWMVPEHGKATALVRDTDTYSDGDPKRPRIVSQLVRLLGKQRDDIVYGICIDDPVCNGHCGYSQ